MSLRCPLQLHHGRWCWCWLLQKSSGLRQIVKRAVAEWGRDPECTQPECQADWSMDYMLDNEAILVIYRAMVLPDHWSPSSSLFSHSSRLSQSGKPKHFARRRRRRLNLLQGPLTSVIASQSEKKPPPTPCSHAPCALVRISHIETEPSLLTSSTISFP